MRTLLSASSAPTIFPASIKDGRSSLYLHTVGTALGFGKGGTSCERTVQRGAACFLWRDLRKASSVEDGASWVAVAVAIVFCCPRA